MLESQSISQIQTVLGGSDLCVATMFGVSKAFVPLFIPLGWGLGYAVTTGLKKVFDHCFPGKDSNEGYHREEEDDLFWKGLPTDTQEQTDPAGKVCSEKATEVCGTTDSHPTRTGLESTEDKGTVSGQTDPAGEVVSEHPTNVCGTTDIGVTETVRDGTKDNRTVFEQTDPAGEVCSKTTVHQEGERTVAEKSDPAGEDLSVADLAAKALAEVTAEALVSWVPALSFPKCSTLKSTFTSDVPIPPSPDGECISEEDGVMNLSKKPSLHARITVALEVNISPDVEAEHRVGLDLPDTGRTATAGNGQTEENFFKFSNELQNSWRQTRIHPVVANRTMDVPADCEGGSERYHLSSVICGDSKPAQFHSYLIKGEQTVKADDEHVFTADSDCSEDMSQNSLIYIYEKVRNDETTNITVSPAPPLEGDKGAFGEEPKLLNYEEDKIIEDLISYYLEAGEL
ncbi:uncharacterized protein LOC122835927 [Gambusia affinis]|uniref:uncharacterized protein LOC122835927 n=1 Tax=Gambusia affinis TaxID=33528 RepID=UPI001CDBF5A1|nr:uncharacterized protein LOC122835927 [Gambusia affinis]